MFISYWNCGLPRATPWELLWDWKLSLWYHALNSHTLKHPVILPLPESYLGNHFHSLMNKKSTVKDLWLYPPPHTHFVCRKVMFQSCLSVRIRGPNPLHHGIVPFSITWDGPFPVIVHHGIYRLVGGWPLTQGLFVSRSNCNLFPLDMVGQNSFVPNSVEFR